MSEQVQTICQFFFAFSFIGIIAYGWYLNDKFEKAGGWSGEPKTNKAK